MAMLGTCEEAAGTPLTPEQIRLARVEENKQRWRLGPRITSQAHDKSDRGALFGFFGLIVLIAAALAGFLWLT